MLEAPEHVADELRADLALQRHVDRPLALQQWVLAVEKASRAFVRFPDSNRIGPDFGKAGDELALRLAQASLDPSPSEGGFRDDAITEVRIIGRNGAGDAIDTADRQAFVEKVQELERRT